MKVGKYMHFKGHLVYVLGVGKHTETEEDMVVYVELGDNPKSTIWVRPKKMFLEKVVKDDKKIPRFTYVSK